MFNSARRAAILTAALAFLLAGCGSSDDEADAPTAEPSPTEAQESTPPEAKETEDAEASEEALEVPTLSDEEIGDAGELLGSLEYVDGADPATCDAVFGAGEDSVMNIFLDGQEVMGADDAITYVNEAVDRIGEVAADAPAEAADELTLLADALALSITPEGRREVEQIMADTEAAMTGLGEYCLG